MRTALEKLGALSAFVHAADTRSFTGAGRQLGLSSSAVGKAVARLEERLGVRLLHRSTRSVTPTQEGQILLESCRRIFSEVEAVEQEFAQARGRAVGRLKISLPLVGTLMMPALGDFMQSYPGVELDMHFTDDLVDVIGEGYDVVVRTGEGHDSRLMSRVVGSYQLQVVGAPSYLERAGIPTSPHHLQSHACLHHRYPTSGLLQRWPLRRDGSGADLVLPVTATANTVEPLILLAERGVGLACVPDFFTRPQIAKGALIEVLSNYVEHAGVFRAVWPSSRLTPPKLRVFIDFLVERLFPVVT